MPARRALDAPPRAQRRPDAQRGAARARDQPGRDRPRRPRPSSARPRRVAARRRSTRSRRPAPSPAPGSAPPPRRSTSTIGPYRRFAIGPADLERAEADQERDRRHRQRRRARRRRRRPRPLPARARPLDPRARAAGDGPDQRPHRRRARRARQPRLLLHGAAAGLVRGPGRAAAPVQRDDGRPEAVQAGRRRDADDRAHRLRPADDRRPGGASAVAPALLQPGGHQRARARSSRST